MSKCPQCGYELFPLDEVCDKCNTPVVSIAATENLITKKPLSKHERVYGAGSAARSKSVGTKAVGAKSSKASASSTRPKAVNKKAASQKAKSVAATSTAAAKTKPSKRNYNDEIIMPNRTAGVEKKKSGAGKVWIIIGCVFGGIIFCAGIGVLVAVMILKGGGNVEYYRGGEDGSFESYDEEFWSEDGEDEEGGYEEWGTGDDWEEWSDDGEYHDDAVPYNEEDGQPYEEGVEYLEEDGEPVQGEENIGRVFNIGETFTYDNVSYTATSFVKIDDESTTSAGGVYTETYSNGEIETVEEGYEDGEAEVEEEPEETLYQLNFTAVNNAGEIRDVDVMGTYYENGEESDTYTADDKDSYATLQAGQSADLAVSIFVRRGASSGLYDLEVGMYEGEVITVKLF